jgi:Tfp pilus assembly protein PilN
MLPDLTNLLPEERTRALRRDYFYRLGTIAALLLTLLLALHAALLILPYRYLESEIQTRGARLDALEQTLGSANEQQLDARLSALGTETAALDAIATSTPQSVVLGETLAVVHPSVLITGLTLAPWHGKIPETVSVSGTAATRDALRAYYLALSSAPFVSAANLPVSSYALAAAIPFTITLTIPTP